MSKLTEEDKIANKAAQKIRDKAYSQRRSQYNKAVDAVREQVEASPENKAMAYAVAALDLGIQDRNNADADILDQIAALQEKRKTLAAEYVPILNGHKTARAAAWQAKDALEQAGLQEVKGDFADVADVNYVGAWTIPAAVQEKMDQAASDARAAYAAEKTASQGADGP